VHVVPTAGRFRRVGKYGSVDWREDCSRCSNCVKLRCEYDAYKKEGPHNRDPLAPIQLLNDCKACFSCVQGCTKGLLALSINPEFLAMGDDYWKPDLILTTWNQSDTGKVPVSGAGYRGRFHGPGFDSIWTDMSEIVRPTRDGIHGREYISTTVDIGLKPLRLKFEPDGRMITPPANLIEIQTPAILDVPPWPMDDSRLALARATSAKGLATLAVMRAEDAARVPADQLPHVMPLVARKSAASNADLLKKVRVAEIPDGPDVVQAAAELTKINPALVVSVRMDLAAGAADRAAAIVKAGLRVVHVVADIHGDEKGVPHPRHIKDVLREVHGRLVKEGVRDEVTLIVTGGIGLAEHMAKAIICGADLVGVDVPLLVSLGCRVCRGAHTDGSAGKGEPCPAEIHPVDVSYAVQRMVNLMGAWHSQLIEVLGAMGIREVRRLRGEVGRAIFREDIEREAFSDLVRK
jgi:ferredoxin